ncbi:hypothetical protein NP493_808g00028 [Ridgeia piscesae]|uniref:Uncharacterized protein n=1 Tax=Ridgeia piscesae TaxID=27915 RepID=A0AAD9KPM4_RIDPI|nr:hypothetical protein NP493_808g00028 [Ridgeia piscesae]
MTLPLPVNFAGFPAKLHLRNGMIPY